MKKLFFGLATSLLLCFAASSADAQVQDTMSRQSNGNMGQQQTWPADSNNRDSINNATPVPDNPMSDPTDRNDGMMTPSDRNGNGNGNDMAPGSRTDTPPAPSAPTTAPGTSTNPTPQSDIPNAPGSNTSPNTPTTPTIGLPM